MTELFGETLTVVSEYPAQAYPVSPTARINGPRYLLDTTIADARSQRLLRRLAELEGRRDYPRDDVIAAAYRAIIELEVESDDVDTDVIGECNRRIDALTPASRESGAGEEVSA